MIKPAQASVKSFKRSTPLPPSQTNPVWNFPYQRVGVGALALRLGISQVLSDQKVIPGKYERVIFLIFLPGNQITAAAARGFLPLPQLRLSHSPGHPGLPKPNFEAQGHP